MEWVETTAKTLEAAKDAALDQLGVGADEAEFDVLDEPRPGLFGRMRGEARVRARVKPAQVRPKQERRRRSGARNKQGRGDKRPGREPRSDAGRTAEPATSEPVSESAPADAADATSPTASVGSGKAPSNRSGRSRSGRERSTSKQEQAMSNDTTVDEMPTVTPQDVGDAAVAFMDGLAAAFGAEASSSVNVDGTELDVQVAGEGLGLLVGPGGRTLTAIQDLARVAAQRRLGDHETRLRIDVAGYRERRAAALTRFAHDVADQVRESGSARSLEPMSSADRKIIHDALNEAAGVSSRSEGDDPHRRVIVVPD